MAKLVICASGNARPMQSASSTGSSITAAAIRGCIELAPPISRDMIALNFLPKNSSIICHRLGRESRIRQPLLGDQRRPHRRDARDPVIIRERSRIHELDPRAVPVQLSHVEIRVIGVSTATRAEDPRAGREGLELRGLEDASPSRHGGLC